MYTKNRIKDNVTVLKQKELTLGYLYDNRFIVMKQVTLHLFKLLHSFCLQTEIYENENFDWFVIELENSTKTLSITKTKIAELFKHFRPSINYGEEQIAIPLCLFDEINKDYTITREGVSVAYFANNYAINGHATYHNWISRKRNQMRKINETEN